MLRTAATAAILLQVQLCAAGGVDFIKSANDGALKNDRQCMRYDILDYSVPGVDPEKTREFEFKLDGCDSLFLSKFPLNFDGTIALAFALEGNKRVEALNLYDCGITEDAIKGLAAALGQQTIALMLGKNAIGDAGAAALAEAFKKMPRLMFLDLSRAEIGSAGTEALLLVLARHPMLATLKLERNKELGDTGATEIAHALRHNKRLRTIDLSRCGITDVGAKELLQALREGLGEDEQAAPQLTTLMLHGNNISEEVLTAIGEELKKRSDEDPDAEGGADEGELKKAEAGVAEAEAVEAPAAKAEGGGEGERKEEL